MRTPSWSRFVAVLVVVSPLTVLAQEPATSPPTGTETPPTGTEAPAATATTTPPPTPPSNAGKSWRELITLDGLVDTYFNARLTGSGAVPMAFHVFDAPSDTFSVAYARLGLAMKPEPVGFRLDLGYGTVANAVAAATGTPVTNVIYQAIPQAYASIAIPTVVPMTLDIGKFWTFAGAEVVDANKNWNYTRSFLFNYAIPLTHTGVRLTIPFTSAFALQLMVVNGWDIVYDVNRAKTFGASASFTAPTGTVIVLNGITGVETVAAPWRFLLDVVITHTMGNLGLMLNGDYGKQGTFSWYGAAAYVRYSLMEHLNLGVRGEVFSDPQNFRLGASNLGTSTGATVESLTLTAGIPFAGAAEIRAEFRGDFASENIFLTNSSVAPPAGFSGSQYQLLLAGLVWF